MLNINQNKFRKFGSNQVQLKDQQVFNKIPKSFTIKLKKPLNKLSTLKVSLKTIFIDSLQKEFNEESKLESLNNLPNSLLYVQEKQKTLEISDETIRSSKLFQQSMQLSKKYKKKVKKLQSVIIICQFQNQKQLNEKQQENNKLQKEIKHYQGLKKKQLKKILKLLKEKAELQEYIAILQDQLHSRYQEEDSYADDFENASERAEIYSQSNQLEEEIFERSFQLHQRRIQEFRNFILQLQSNQMEVLPIGSEFSSVDPDQMTYEEQIGYVNKGLTQEEIDKIPSVQYSPNQQFDEDICAICQCQWEEGDSLKTLHCNHNYHAQCIDEWLKKNKNCPVCKQEV